MLNLSDRKWSAVWIENSACPNEHAPLFLKEFSVDDPSKNARLYISGVGFYVARINGRRVGDALLAPAFSAYDKTVYYNVYDVSDLLTVGQNTIEVTLGNGWFNEIDPVDWNFHYAAWKRKPQLICELISDGKVILRSDSSWATRSSRITYNSLRFGETFDAAMDEPSDIHRARVSRGAGGFLKEQRIQPIRLQEEISPVCAVSAPDGGVTYDFGVNLTGNTRICVRGVRGGKISLTYSEIMLPDGSIDIEDIHGSTKLVERFQRDEYILSGEGEEVWQSEFGYNGFRYAHVVCENCELLSVTARCFHTDLPRAGSFVSDNALINNVQSALLRATRTNFHHIPTDCPHREKNGWTGDAHLSCEQALFNFDMKQAYLKWTADIVDSQRGSGEIPAIVPTSVWGFNWGNGPTWDLALFEIPWQTYLHTADQAILKQCIQAQEKYISFLEFSCDDGIWRNALGDWCAPKDAPKFPREFIVTAYAWRAFDLHAKALKALGRAEEAAVIRARADEIRKTIQTRFLDRLPDTQTTLSILLAFGLSDTSNDELIARLEKCIHDADDHMTTGIFGTKLIYNALTDNGRFDLAWKLFTAEGYPGWSDMLRRCPSTLIENWDNSGSLNHHMYSSIGDWFYKGIAGIHLDPDAPGYAHISLRPHIPEGCAFFRAEHDAPTGRLIVEWKNSALHVTLPEGTCADLYWKGGHITLNAGEHHI